MCVCVCVCVWRPYGGVPWMLSGVHACWLDASDASEMALGLPKREGNGVRSGTS